MGQSGQEQQKLEYKNTLDNLLKSEFKFKSDGISIVSLN